MKKLFAVWLVLSIAVPCSAAFPQSTSAAQSAGTEEQTLRARVQDFYSLVQVGRFSEAESYLTEDSKMNFRYQRHGPFLGFEIKTVKLDAGGQSATVGVLLQTLAPQFSTTPIPATSTSHWRLIRGAWYAVIPKPDPEAMKKLFSSTPGTTGFKVPPLPPEQLNFKGHTYTFADFPEGAVKVAPFPFKNETDHTVTITDVDTGCDCLKAQLAKKQYAPGESGELAIAFDSKGYEKAYAQTIVVKTDPKSVSFLDVRGFILSPADQAARAAQEQTPAKPKQ